MHYIAGKGGERNAEMDGGTAATWISDIIALPGWSDATSKISLLMEAMRHSDRTSSVRWNMEADYTKWVDAGLLVDVSPYMKKYTNMVDYYNSVDPGVMVPMHPETTEFTCHPWRRCRAGMWGLCGSGKNWLDNLGLAVPTTLDELDELKEIHGKRVEDYQKLPGKSTTNKTTKSCVRALARAPLPAGCIFTGILRFALDRDGEKW